MKSQWQKDVDGYFCPVCLDEAARILYRTLTAYIPAPGIVYYSNSGERWENCYVSSKIICKYGTLTNNDNFNAIVSDLQQGKITQNIINLMAEAEVTGFTAEAEIIPTVEKGIDSRGVWYIRTNDYKKLFCIITFRTALKSEITICGLHVPPFFEASVFDGITVGSEQHLFSVGKGNLYYGILDTKGELKNNVIVESVPGLTQNVSSAAATCRSSQIWTAVIDSEKAKLCAYSLHQDLEIPKDLCKFQETVIIKALK